MCRFAFYLGPKLPVSDLVTEPEHSIINQSVHAREREEPLNGDGFGIAWYDQAVSAHPAVFKEVRPAWSSINLTSLAPFARSNCILAHVRAASMGLSVIQLNCHPFACGPYSFMHNGVIGGFLTLKRELLGQLSDRAYFQIQGSTDSELLFSLITDRLDSPDSTLEEMASAVRSVIQDIESLAADRGLAETSHLNLVFTNGEQAVVTRYGTPGGLKAQTLYLQQGSRFHCEQGQCRMDAPGENAGCVLLASEPLSAEGDWQCVPANHMLTIDETRTVRMEPLATERRL